MEITKVNLNVKVINTVKRTINVHEITVKLIQIIMFYI